MERQIYRIKQCKSSSEGVTRDGHLIRIMNYDSILDSGKNRSGRAGEYSYYLLENDSCRELTEHVQQQNLHGPRFQTLDQGREIK